MATAAVQYPSYNRVEPGSNHLQAAAYPKASPADAPKPDADSIASDWVNAFNAALAGKHEAIKALFLPNACWRDQLALSWDFHNLNGTEAIISFLNSASKGSRVTSVAIDASKAYGKPHAAPIDYHGNINGVASFLTVETDVGRGRGLVRLLQDQEDGGKWKAFTLFTAMHELKGHEETVFGNRPLGVEHGGMPGRKNWLERRRALENFEDGVEPTVLILGITTFSLSFVHVH